MHKFIKAAMAAIFFFILLFNHNGGHDHRYVLGDNMEVSRELQPIFDHIVEGLIEGGVKMDLSQPIKITFETGMPIGVLGIAKGMFDAGRVEIQINPSLWFDLNITEKYWVLAHEMGHDFFKIFHHGNGIMRQYHREGESRKTLLAKMEEFITEIRIIHSYTLPMVRLA